jgi:hypothetical protein
MQMAISFVSVTQQFNTTTSMGRLTLNVLLSFAQFEREIAGERIRDKIKASRQAKGMWMGGNPSLGYDIRDRRLVINDEEAAQGLLHLQTVPGTAERLETAGGSEAARYLLQAAGLVPQAYSMAGTPLLVDRYITCSRTASTWARPPTKAKTIPASTTPSSTLRRLMRYSS